MRRFQQNDGTSSPAVNSTLAAYLDRVPAEVAMPGRHLRSARATFSASSLLLITFCLSIAFPFPILCEFRAYASTSGQPTVIRLSVVDDKNQPVPGAIVELQFQGTTLTRVVTDKTGKASITPPSAGKYVLIVSKKDYLSTQAPLEVEAENGPEQVDVVLPENALGQQNVTVQAKSHDAVTEQAGTQATLAPVQAKETPSKPATLTDALPLLPGVVRRNDGTLDIAGYAESHSTLLVNSVDVTDPSTGSFGLSVPIDSVETISVSEMPYLAQYGKFIAGVVAAETRRGGDKWNFSLNDPLPEFRIRSGHLVGLKTATPRINFTGPLITNRLFISEGSEVLVYKRAVRTLPFPVNETKSTAINSFTQVDGIISPNQMFTATFHFAPRSVRYAGLNFFNPQPVTPDADVHSSTATVLDRLAVAGGVVQSTVAITQVSSGIRSQGIESMVLTPGGNQGNYFSQQSRRATRFQWIENWEPRALHFGGVHSLQIGSVLGYSEDEGQLHARPVQIQDAARQLLQTIDFTPGRPFAIAEYEPAVYFQDHWVRNSRFAMDFGVRLEAQTITQTRRAAPRWGFVWTPGSGRTVIRGGIGIFFDSVPLGTYAFSSYPEQIVTSYDPSQGMLGDPVHYLNITDQIVHSNFPLVNRAQTSGNFAPYSLAWNLEAERPLNRWVTVRIKYLQSRARDLITLQPEIVQNQHALVLGSSGSAQTRQYELTAKIGIESRRQFFFSYVRQHARGDIASAGGYISDFPFPVVRQNLRASLAGEIPNRFLLWGIYALPRKVQLSPLLEYRNGFPYQPTNVLQQYIASASGPQYRFPRYFTFDLRASKDLQVTKKYAVRFSASMLNLTNHFNALDVHSNVADPRYGLFFGNYPRRLLLDFDVLY